MDFGLFAQPERQTLFVKGMHIHQGANISVFGDLKNMDTVLLNDGHLTMIGDSLMIKAPMTGTGTLEMLGRYDQYILYKGKITVDSLILNNVLDISFDNDIVIDKHASFVNGILYDNYDVTYSPALLPSVTFTENADLDSTLVRDNSHIEGVVTKEGNTRFVFPIGDNYYYRPAEVSNFSSKTSVSTQYYYEWINFPDELPLGVVLFKDEYWYVNSDDKVYDLTLSYDDRTSIFDPDEKGINIAAFDVEFETRDSFMEAETTSIMDKVSYMGRLLPQDSTFVWYGFATVDPEQTEVTPLSVAQVLSPNGDGVNDFFVIQGLSRYPDNKLVIFNRYGDVLYEMENYDNSWGGTANKKVIGGNGDHLLPSGTYFVFFYDDGKLIYKDFVQLLRTE